MTTNPSPLQGDPDVSLPAAAYLRYQSRADGWSAGRQAACLAYLADNGIADDAVRSVGMSRSGSYALRRQARGYAFNLGWEAALLVARRVVADDLMTAAVRGEVSRWVRVDGETTYTRQNTKLSVSLLDRVNPATSLSEVMAVVVRFDCYLQMIDEGLSAQELWEEFFDVALPHSDIEARERVRAALQLSEESAGFEDEAEDADDRKTEYKSMDGAGLYNASLPAKSASRYFSFHAKSAKVSKSSARHFTEGALQLTVVSECPTINPPQPLENLCVLRVKRNENGRCETELHLACDTNLSPQIYSPLGEMPAFDQSGHHARRNGQNAAIIKAPDRVADPASLGQRPHAREDQHVRSDKGHCACSHAVAREIAVPCGPRHCGNEQRVGSGLDRQQRIVWQEIQQISSIIA